jgi:hypothetical protein
VTGSDGRPVAIDWNRLPTRPCPVAESLDLFGDRWSILNIRDVMTAYAASTTWSPASASVGRRGPTGCVASPPQASS